MAADLGIPTNSRLETQAPATQTPPQAPLASGPGLWVWALWAAGSRSTTQRQHHLPPPAASSLAIYFHHVLAFLQEDSICI